MKSSYPSSTDYTSSNNFCYKELKELEEITFNEMKVGEVSKDCIIYVKTITDACLIESTCVKIIVEDKHGDAISLYLYNQAIRSNVFEDLIDQFPVEIDIAIK